MSQAKVDKYKEDKKRVNKFLFNFDYQHIFRDIVKNVLRSGVYYCWYRETPKKRGVQKYGMQMLPQKYCKITGYWENGILYDIDLSFLLSATVDLGLYAPIFGKYYDELFNVNSSENYKPCKSRGQKKKIKPQKFHGCITEHKNGISQHR